MNPKKISDMDVSNIDAVLFDIDDTFSSDGKITAEAYGALWDLKRAGKLVVPITGRPAGWCDHIARMWPVDGVIGENGAFYFMMKAGRMRKISIEGDDKRDLYRKKLKLIEEEVLSCVPGCALASDQSYREFDLAIDFCEDVSPLPDTDVDRIVEIFERHGARTKISSIHVNGWFGDYDKLAAAKIFVRDELSMDLDRDNERFVFCGDSPNDEPMFSFFKNSVGVANVMDFEMRIVSPPKYITQGRMGAGFAELARKLISG